MEEEQKQLIYISGENINNSMAEKQKEYIENILKLDSVNYFLINVNGFFYIGFTSFAKPIMVTPGEYEQFIDNFRNKDFHQRKTVKLDSKSYEIDRLFGRQKIEICDLKNITNNKLLKHKLINIHKVELVKYLKENKKIYLSDTDYKNLIINDHLPYLDYEDLKQDLKILYKDKSFDTARIGEKKVVFDQLTNAISYAKVLTNNKIKFVLLVIDKNLFLIYHQDNKNSMVDYEMKEENYKEIIEFLFGDEMENIINKKLPLCDEKGNARNFNFINGLDNYIIDNINQENKITLNGHTNTRNNDIKINNNDIDFDVIYQYKKSCQIIIIYKDKQIKIKEDFYMPNSEDNLDKLALSLNLLWVGGHLMSDYDYNFYIKHKKILFNDIRLPEWFNCVNKKELKHLFSFVSNLQTTNNLDV